MNPIEILAENPHPASLLNIVLIETVGLYAGYGTILQAGSDPTGFYKVTCSGSSPGLATAAISYSTLMTLNASSYQPSNSAD